MQPRHFRLVFKNKTMKKLSFYSFLIILMILTASAKGQQEKPDDIRKIYPFDRITVLGNINCELIKGDAGRIEIFTTNISPEKIITQLSGGKLQVRQQIGLFDGALIRVKVYYDTLYDIQASAGASISSEEVFDLKRLKLGANMGSIMKIHSRTQNLDVSSEQGSDVVLIGNTRRLEIDINTGGKVRAFDLQSELCNVEITAGGTAEVFASRELDTEVSLGGTVKYKGNPGDVYRNTNLGGNIYPVE